MRQEVGCMPRSSEGPNTKKRQESVSAEKKTGFVGTQSIHNTNIFCNCPLGVRVGSLAYSLSVIRHIAIIISFLSNGVKGYSRNDLQTIFTYILNILNNISRTLF